MADDGRDGCTSTSIVAEAEGDDITDALPDTILLAILSLLEAPDLLRCSVVCKRWLRLGREPVLWRGLGKLQAEFSSSLEALRASTGADPPDWLGWYQERTGVSRRWRTADPASVVTLDDHAGTVFGVSTIPGHPQLIASGGEDAILRIWNTATTRVVIAETSSNLSGIFNVHSFPAPQGGPWVIACGFSGDVNVHKVESHPNGVDELTVAELRVLLQPRMPAEGDLFHQLSKAELVECAERRGIASPATARVQHTFVGHSAPVVACRGRGDVLATSSFDSSIRLWRMEAGAAGAQPRRGAAAPEVTSSLAVLTDGDEPFMGGPHENSIACVCLPEAQPGLLMRGGNDSMVKVWDIPSRTVLRSYGGHAGWIWCLEATDDSGHVLLSGATDMTLRLWDTRALGNSPELHNELVRSSGPVAGLKVLPDQRRFVTGSFDRGVRIWDLRAMSVCSPCGRMTGPARGTQRSGSLGAPGCCDAESFIEVLFLRLHERSPTPQASSAASGSRALIGTLTGHQDRTTRVDATVDSIYSASFDSTVKIWNFI